MVALFMFFACGCSSWASARIDSGLTGRVVLGPTCPVQRTGESCERGYQTTMAVFTAASHRLVTTFRSGPDGRFRVGIRPGRYTLQGAHRGLPRFVPATVTVRPDRYTGLTIKFDTGIR